MKFDKTPLNDAYLISLDIKNDDRGWFTRTFCAEEFGQHKLTQNWVQMNHSMTNKKGTIRGLHYQLPPHSEAKLVRCIRGIIFDVILDLRENSSTFLQHFAVELSAQNSRMVYIPEGFAHGFQTLTDNVELIYHHSTMYTPSSENGIRFDDQLIGIKWPILATEISERDKSFSTINKDFKGITL